MTNPPGFEIRMTPPVAVASTNYIRDGQRRSLSSWSIAVESLHGLDLQRHYLSHPERASLPNTAFMVVDSAPEDLSRGQVVWIAYIFRNAED